MAEKGWYRNTEHGYQCVVCLGTFIYAESARQCCLDGKPAYSLEQAQDIMTAYLGAL